VTEAERAVLEAVQAEERGDWLEAAAAWLRAGRAAEAEGRAIDE
jgi:hypothetical protein